jgi:tRNA G18 (ribose-2'-O)-methylase SpoU
MRVSGLFLCGYTAHPPHLKLDKTSLGTTEFVPWKWFSTTQEAIRHCKSLGVPVWAAETTTRSVPFNQITYPEKLALVFGNEALGISRDVLDLCDTFVQIPLFGFKNSINVATSVAVIGFQVIERIGTIKNATTCVR